MANGTGGLGGAGADANSMSSTPVGSSVVPCSAPGGGGGGGSGGGGGGGGTSPPSPTPTPTPTPPPIGPVITLARPLVLVRKSFIPHPPAVVSRTEVTLTVTDPGAFDGSGTFTVTSAGGARVNFFDDPNAGTLVTTTGKGFTAAELNVGVRLFAEGELPSAAMDDITLELSLTPGSRPVLPPATATMTAIEVTLDIHESRTAPATDPAALSNADKIDPGRTVHAQNASFHHGRALLIVRKAVPNAFPGDLELRAFDANVQLFRDPDEVAAAGQAAEALPLTISNGAIPAAGMRFWAEGVDGTVSTALHDTGFRLGVAGLGQDGDWARMTVVQFRNLRARIRATPPNTARMGNAAASHNFLLAGTAASDFDEDFTTRRPLVLVENSVEAGREIDLSVEIRPAGVPVMWSIQRVVQPGTADPLDHADVVALSPSAVPTLDPTGSVTLTAKLLTDAVGSFHIRPFVDCNNSSAFERNDAAGARIDREPYMLMNLVLARVTLNTDNSRTHAGNFVGSSDGAGGIGVTGGAFNIAAPATASIHMNATIEVVGGGADGKLGLNRIFAGWVNNESAAEDIVGTYRDSSVAPAVNRTHSSVFASNGGTATGAHPSGSPGFLPGDPAPALVAAPLLDTGRGTPGTGGDTATLTRSRIRTRTDLAPAPGQRWIVEAVDSPGDSEPANHLGFPAAVLTNFHFVLRFRAALCIWTNFSGASGATGNSADRLYSVVRRYNWTMRGDWTITPATGAVAAVAAPTVTISGANTTSPSGPVRGTGIEVRAPTGLSLLARDCRA